MYYPLCSSHPLWFQWHVAHRLILAQKSQNLMCPLNWTNELQPCPILTNKVSLERRNQGEYSIIFLSCLGCVHLFWCFDSEIDLVGHVTFNENESLTYYQQHIKIGEVMCLVTVLYDIYDLTNAGWELGLRWKTFIHKTCKQSIPKGSSNLGKQQGKGNRYKTRKSQIHIAWMPDELSPAHKILGREVRSGVAPLGRKSVRR